MIQDLPPKPKKVKVNVLIRVLKLVRPFKLIFFAATFLALLLAILGPLRPFLVSITVDEYILKFDMQGLQVLALILVGALLLESFLRYFFIFITNWLGQTIIKDLRIRVFDHIIHQKPQYFDKTPIGTATTRTINDIETINDIFSQGLITIIADLLSLIAIIIFMAYTDWKLTLVSLATFPLLVYSTYVFKEKVKKAFHDVRTQVARMNAFLQERISGMRIIQIFAAEKKEYNKFKSINEEHKEANVRAIMYYSIFFPVVEVILASAIGLMVWYGTNSVINEGASLGVLIAFILYLNMLFRPLRMLADKFNSLQMGIVASERVFSVLDDNQKIENTGTLSPEKINGHITFEDVWFAYNDDEYVLKGVSFEIHPGQAVAVVGATGSGKTSIINTLIRFYEFQKGDIKLDGTSIRGYDLDTLRKFFVVVQQDVFLFSGSVHDNVTLRNPNITREMVIAAAQEAGAHDFIMKLPGNYDYLVMERGLTLSMGQRQLIAFVRALVFNPQILILDEATSSIDTESELIIQQATEKLIRNRTSIMIAHRLSTIQKADMIIALDKGKVIETGTHDELLRKDGYYRKLHDMQFSKERVNAS